MCVYLSLSLSHSRSLFLSVPSHVWWPPTHECRACTSKHVRCSFLRPSPRRAHRSVYPLCSHSPLSLSLSLYLHTTFLLLHPSTLNPPTVPPLFFSFSLTRPPTSLSLSKARQHYAPTATALADAHGRLFLRSPVHAPLCVRLAVSRRCAVRVVGGVGGRTRDTGRWWGRERVIRRGGIASPRSSFSYREWFARALPRARFSAQPLERPCLSSFSFFSGSVFRAALPVVRLERSPRTTRTDRRVSGSSVGGTFWRESWKNVQI